MLKITYLEDEIYLEYLQKSVEAWKKERILVNLRAAVSVYTESSTASLVLPVNLSCLRELVNLAEKKLISIIPCDEEYIEVSFPGTWISQTEDNESGIFVCELGNESEYFLYQLWQESQVGDSVVSE
ncbi:MAG: alr0857 family protein [Waterburya sp.]